MKNKLNNHQNNQVPVNIEKYTGSTITVPTGREKSEKRGQDP
jgi:hypothetical protein